MKEQYVIRRVIGGRLYDTSKSELIGVYPVPKNLYESMYERLNIEDYYSYLDVRLHKTANDNFFVTCGRNLAEITTLEVKDILSYEPETYVKYFGEVEEA